jgi:hypothetical protein
MHDDHGMAYDFLDENTPKFAKDFEIREKCCPLWSTDFGRKRGLGRLA